MKILEIGKSFEERRRGTFRWSAVLVLSTGLAALFMFLVHVIAVRNLTTSEYGEFASAIALVGIVGVAASSVQASTVRDVKQTDEARTRKMTVGVEYLSLVTISLSLGVFSYLVVNVAFSTALLLAFWTPAAIMIARANGELQGREIQSLLHGATAAITFITLILSILLLAINSSVESLLIARLAVTVLCATVLLRFVNVRVRESLLFVSARLVHSTMLVTSMWFAANLDVLLSRKALDDVANGEIAIAAMLVNSVLLIPGLVAAVIYPRALEHRRHRTKSFTLLIFSVVLSGIVQITIAVALLFSSDYLVDWLAGSEHETAKSIVFPLALAYIPLGISIVVSQFVLALGNLSQSSFFLSCVLLISVGLLQASSGALDFVKWLNVASWVLVLVLIGISVFNISRITNEIN